MCRDRLMHMLLKLYAVLGNGNPDEAIMLRLMLLGGPKCLVNRMHGADSSLRVLQPKL